MQRIDEEKLKNAIQTSSLMNGWITEKTLGRGRESIVFEICRHTDAGEEHSALKAVYCCPTEEERRHFEEIGMTEEGIKQLFLQRAEREISEIKVLQRLQGEAYLVTYYDFDIVKPEDDTGRIILIRMEKLIPLKTYLRYNALSEERVVNIALCIAYAINACHKLLPSPVMHGDIKPDNIYHFKDDLFKLGDFDISSLGMNQWKEQRAGTPYYMAPECTDGVVTPRSDIYSLGKTILMLLKDNRAQPEETVRPLHCRSDALWALIQDMTAISPALRPENIEEVIRRLKAINNPDNDSWYYLPNHDNEETITDYLSEDTETQNAELLLLEDESSFAVDLPTQEDTTPEKQSVAETLGEEFNQELVEKKKRIHKRCLKIIMILVCVALMVLLGLIIGSKKQNTVVPELSASIDNQSVLTVQWKNAEANTSLVILSAQTLLNTPSLPLPDQVFDFAHSVTGAQVSFAIEKNGTLQATGFAPGTVYRVALLHNGEIQTVSCFTTPIKENDPSYEIITHLLYSYSKSEAKGFSDDHTELMRKYLLVKLDDKTILDVSNTFTEKQGIYIHLTSDKPLVSTQFIVSLSTDLDTFVLFASDLNGKAGIFGNNKLYIKLDDLLEAMSSYNLNNSSFSLSIFSENGLVYSFNGEIKN